MEAHGQKETEPTFESGCKYCREGSPLDSVAEEWLFDENVDMGIVDVAFGAVIHPDEKTLSLNVVTSPVITKELLSKQIPINYCPMCGRKL